MRHAALAFHPSLVVDGGVGTHGLGNQGCLPHRGQGRLHGGGFGVDRLRGVAGQHGQGATGEVGDQLVPYLGADGRRCLPGDTAFSNQVGQGQHAIGQCAVRLAQDEAALGLFDIDDAGFDHRAGGIDHPADRTPRPERPPQHIVGIDTGEGFARVRSG